MNAVRGLLRDLIERKLWIVAVLLLAAAVGVPVYIGRSASGDDSAPPATQQAKVDKASKAAVTIEDPTAGADRPGAVRNPFKQHALPKAPANAATGSTTTPSNGGTNGSTSSGGASGGSDGSQPVQTPTGSGTGSGTKTPTPQDTDKLDLYHLTVRVGRADGSLKTLKDVARLSPLPSVDDPFLVYTGVLEDGKTAVFLLSSDAKATGDGKCKPSTEDCESIEVKKGDSEFFDLAVDGQPVQYELDVLDVIRQDGSSSSSSSGSGSGPASASAAQRHSNAGAELLRKAHVTGSKAYKNAEAYRWLPARGVLVRTPKHGGAQASVTGAVAASPADLAATLPGQPVWHWKLGG
jgi:hypothetical protein